MISACQSLGASRAGGLKQQVGVSVSWLVVKEHRQANGNARETSCLWLALCSRAP